jgi:uncharacterized protein (DUF433 family)
LVDGIASIDFSDLIEIRFLDAFRKHGVSWKAIHIAAERAKDLIGKSHPFSSNIFKTDGRTILAEIIDQSGDKTLLDLVKDQYAFEKIISPFLYKGIEFNQTNEPERWWPLGFKKSVVLDPHRSFGAPITATGGVPTSIINRALKSENSIEAVADWYDISLTEVKDAIYFEREFLAA